MTTKEASDRIFQDHSMHSHHLLGDNAGYSLGGGGGMEYYYPMFQMNPDSHNYGLRFGGGGVEIGHPSYGVPGGGGGYVQNYGPAPQSPPFMKGRGTKKKGGTALSALTLLAFLFFLNLLQSCLKENMDAMNPTVMVMTSGSREDVRRMDSHSTNSKHEVAMDDNNAAEDDEYGDDVSYVKINTRSSLVAADDLAGDGERNHIAANVTRNLRHRDIPKKRVSRQSQRQHMTSAQQNSKTKIGTRGIA